jgi:hypothetical protein
MPTLPPYIGGVPRIGSRVNVTPRKVFLSGPEFYLAGGRVLSGACSRDPGATDVTILRPGMLMGMISSVVNSLGTTGYFAPSILGVTTNAEAAGSTSIEAAAAVVTELARRCGSTGTFTLVGPPTASGVVNRETVTYSAASGTTITVTATTNAFVAGSLIMPTDGSENPMTIIPDGWGIKVTDPLASDASQDQDWADIPIGGVIDASQVVNWPSDASLKAWLVGQLNTSGYGRFTFDHLYLV